MWVAITVILNREVAGGTVGGRIPWANTPRENRYSENFMHASASPTMSGRIWLWLSPTL